LFFVVGDLAAEGFGVPFYLFGVYRDRGQLVEQKAALFKAGPGSHGGHHAQDTGRQAAVTDSQRTIAWAESMAAGGAVIVGSFQPQRSQNRFDGLASTIHIARLRTAGAIPPSPGVVGPVCVQMSFQGARGQAQGATSGGGFPGFEIDLSGGRSPDQMLDFLPDFRLEAGLEPPFLTASAVSVDAPFTSSSAHCSQIFQ
jgi:hypothetical protein